MSGRLQGKVALVTGGAQGIGAAIVRRFALEGARVAINVRRRDDRVEPLLCDLGAAGAVFEADVADGAAVAAMFADVGRVFGAPDIVVNNAGINVFNDPLALSDDEWERCFAVDLKGAWHCCQAALPAMLARAGGSIVNIASVHGHKIIPGAFPYPVAKHGLIGLTRALGIQYAAQGVRVNSISPGLIRTPRAEDWLATLTPEQRQRQIDLLPCKRIGEADEVAYTALFLASDEARFINATDILIDGGRSQLYHE